MAILIYIYTFYLANQSGRFCKKYNFFIFTDNYTKITKIYIGIKKIIG